MVCRWCELLLRVAADPMSVLIMSRDALAM